MTVGLDECGQKYPDMFPVCAVTCAQRARVVLDSPGREQEMTRIAIPLLDLPPSVPWAEWVKSQLVDQSLSSVLTSVLPVSELRNVIVLFLQDQWSRR